MSDIPSFAYELPWQERQLVSVANLTRRGAREFMALTRAAPQDVQATTCPLARADEALADPRSGRLAGAAVLIP